MNSKFIIYLANRLLIKICLSIKMFNRYKKTRTKKDVYVYL